MVEAAAAAAAADLAERMKKTASNTNMWRHDRLMPEWVCRVWANFRLIVLNGSVEVSSCAFFNNTAEGGAGGVVGTSSSCSCGGAGGGGLFGNGGNSAFLIILLPLEVEA